MDKLKVRQVADGSQQGRHRYDFVSSATILLQVVYLLLNIATYHRYILSTVNIRGAFLNGLLADSPVYLKKIRM